MTADREYWNQLADQTVPAPTKPPLASFSGDEAIAFAAEMFDENTDATELLDRMADSHRQSKSS